MHRCWYSIVHSTNRFIDVFHRSQAPGNVLLTGDPPERQQAGSLWYKTRPLPIYQAFETTFQFRIGSNDPVLMGGDGIAFVIQNSSSTSRALGGPGSDLGISKSTRFRGDAGVENSVVIKIDTFDDVGFQVRSCIGRGVTAVNDVVSKCRYPLSPPIPSSVYQVHTGEAFSAEEALRSTPAKSRTATSTLS